MLFGDATVDGMAWVSPITQLVTAGGFGAFAWYLVIRHIPTIEDRHREERKEWLGYLSKRDSDVSALVRETHQLREKVLTSLVEMRAEIKSELGSGRK